MKVLYTVILLLAITQLVKSKSLQASEKYNETTALIKLYNDYIKERNSLARETCNRMESVLHEIISNKTLRKPETISVQEFKNNISEIVVLFPLYKQYGLYHEILSKLQLIADPYFFEEEVDNNDSQYFLSLLKKLDFVNIINDYEEQIMNFLQTKFLKKLKVLRKHAGRNQTETLQEILSLADEMKDCEDYYCFDYHIDEINEIILTPKKMFFDYIRTELIHLSLFYGSGIYNVLRQIPHDKKLLELPNDIRQTLLQNILQFLDSYESKPDNIDEFVTVVNAVYDNVLSKFHESEDNSEIPVKQRKFIYEIFNDHGLEQFTSSYQKKFEQFFHYDLVEEFQYLKDVLSEEDLAKERKFLDSFEHFISLIKVKDQYTLFDELDKILS